MVANLNSNDSRAADTVRIGNMFGLVRREFTDRSVQSRALSLGIFLIARPLLNAAALALRAPLPYSSVDHLGRVLRSAPGTTRKPVVLQNCQAELTTPHTVRGDRYVIYMHGGAFLVGGRHLHSQMISHLARDLCAEVLGVNYRKMPRHSIPDAVEDCLDAYRHVLASGVRAENISFVGDSAGAYLVFMTAIAAGEQGLPMPGAIVSMAPPTDFELESKVGGASANKDRLFSKFTARRLFQLMESVPGTPRSLVGADCTGLPPSLIQVSSAEMLYQDAERFAAELDRFGVPCELQVWHGQVHIFQAASRIVPEAAHAMSEIVEFIDRTLAARSVAKPA